jgi:uncharacterized membrane protein SpoIIM required for sporulation
VILDLPRFLAVEEPFWTELEGALDRMEEDPSGRLTLEEVERLHYLYERASADLGRVRTFSAETATIRRLEALVARAYAEIHETRRLRARASVGKAWRAFPQAFRRRIAAFQLAVVVTLAGCALGWFAIRFDPQSKPVLMPFEGLMETPQERVAREEAAGPDRMAGHKTSFSAQLMTHNIQVSFTTLALGVTWGLGTLLVVFYNGVTLGAVATDYVLAGKSVFLMGWLLPHGVIEIPAILVAAQAGFVLAGALIGQGSRLGRRDRLREVGPDVLTLALGAAAMLVWAGIVEAFLSQYHRPVLPYEFKIAFGCVEAAALTAYLAGVGRK